MVSGSQKTHQQLEKQLFDDLQRTQAEFLKGKSDDPDRDEKVRAFGNALSAWNDFVLNRRVPDR
jgi:hypothetical protein